MSLPRRLTLQKPTCPLRSLTTTIKNVSIPIRSNKRVMPLYYSVILSLVSLSFPMISPVTRMFSTSLKNIGEETLNDIPGSNTKICGGLDLQRGASLDILQEG